VSARPAQKEEGERGSGETLHDRRVVNLVVKLEIFLMVKWLRQEFSQA
jgi:hypothetical protein